MLWDKKRKYTVCWHFRSMWCIFWNVHFFFFHLDCDFLNTKLGCRIKMHKSWFDKWHVTVVASIYKTSYKLKGSALASISCAISYLNRALTWAFKMSSWYFFLSRLSLFLCIWINTSSIHWKVGLLSISPGGPCSFREGQRRLLSI